MGKTKIKAIGGRDELVEKLKEELGVETKEKPQPKSGQPMAEKKIKPSKQKPRSKKYLEASKDLDRNKSYPLPEALELIKKLSYSKFDGTLEAHINTIQTGLRGLVTLPFASGKKLKILGPRGLMPNPKNGTITDNPAKAVESFQQGKTEYKTEAKAPVIHLALGKLNQPTEELVANVKMLLQTIGKTKIKKVSLSPTMGAGVKLDLASI